MAQLAMKPWATGFHSTRCTNLSENGWTPDLENRLQDQWRSVLNQCKVDLQGLWLQLWLWGLSRQEQKRHASGEEQDSWPSAAGEKKHLELEYFSYIRIEYLWHFIWNPINHAHQIYLPPQSIQQVDVLPLLYASVVLKNQVRHSQLFSFFPQLFFLLIAGTMAQPVLSSFKLLISQT